MKDKQAKYPQLRFKGFTDPWEERKLSDFSKTNYGGGTPKTAVTEYWDGNIPWIQSSNLTVDDVQEVNLDKFITDDAIKNSAAKLIPANSIAIVTRVGVGKLTLMKQEFATSQDFLSLSELHVDEQFGLYSIYKLLQKELNNIQGTSIKGMTKADLLTKNIMIPVEKDEQIKIGSFFKQLDDTIVLHQRKLAKLKELKQGYLQKLFPKNGAKVPELRFAGFADAWEQRKLEKVFDTITDYVANGSFESLRKNVNSSDINGFAYLVRLQDASNNWQGPWLYTDQHGYEFLKKSRLQPDDIIMANVGSVGKFFLVPKLDKPMTLAPNAVLIKSSENDQGFLYQTMLTPEMQYKIFEKTTPGVQSKINKTDFKMIETRLPNMDEQKKIGAFFKQLDDTIALHQHKLNLLKEQKKGFLQNMFV